MMNLECSPYLTQEERLPIRGRQILAQYTDSHIIVYQAYSPLIGRFAAEHGYFGDGFSLERMSWIKPGFLWMMHRSGWATKDGQTVILAIRLHRWAFDLILRQAVLSAFAEGLWPDEGAWHRDLQNAAVRVQWDPDHSPTGAPLARRAIQLGLKGETLSAYASAGKEHWIASVDDITSFVHEQRRLVNAAAWTQLMVPLETVYPIADICQARRIGITA